MAGDPGYESKPVQEQGYANAVAFVANTPQKAGVAVIVSCTVTGTLVLVTRNGQTVTVNVPVGMWVIPLSCSQMNTSTFTGTALNCW